MIEQTIYDRLQPVTTNVYPDTPTENTGLPFVVYRVSGTEAQLHTQGVSAITKYTVEVDAYAENKAEVSALQAAVRTQLHGYRGGQIQGAFLQSESGEEIELGYHGQQTFVVWASTANVTATTDSTGSIQTGPNSVSLSACEHTLTLDCDGLKLDGEPVGQTPDLSAYARKDEANTFDATQTVDSLIANNGATLGRQGTQLPVALTIEAGADATTKISFQDDGSEGASVVYQGDGGALMLNSEEAVNLTAPNIYLNGASVTTDGYLRLPNVNNGWVLLLGNVFVSQYAGASLDIGNSAAWIQFDGGNYANATMVFARNGRNLVLSADGSNTARGVVVRGTSGQTTDLLQLQNSGGTALTKIDKNGGIVPASMSNATAANGTLYYSTDAGKLVFKDGGGVVNNLY